MATGRRRRPFGDRLEIERAESSIHGNLEKLRSPGSSRAGEPGLAMLAAHRDPGLAHDVVVAGLGREAAKVDAAFERQSAPVRLLISVAGALGLIAVAWAIEVFDIGAHFVERPRAFIGLVFFAAAICGPAILLAGVANWWWPPPPPSHAEGVGGGLLEEQRRSRLWTLRAIGFALGILHAVTILIVA